MTLIASILLAAATAVAGGTAKITAGSAYYDRKEGFAYFSGKVFVEDATYSIHADRAYVFMNGTNDLKRIVAIGNVAMTNENKRAYGAKASYYRAPGMVVLTAPDGGYAEVREEKPEGPQIVRGRKIKFWTETKQVEVIDANITAPTKNVMGGMKNTLGR